MARQGFTALSLAVLLALFEIGSCLRCYQCSSELDKSCADPYKPDNRHLIDCNTQESVNYNTQTFRTILSSEFLNHVTGASRYCHKIVLQNGATIRTCLDGNPSDLNQTCRSLELTAKTTQAAGLSDPLRLKSCSVCDKDNCNGASSASFSIPLATLALIATYLLCKQ